MIQFDQAHDDLAISLWEERIALRPQFIAASRALREATDRLPDWAKPGPCYLNHDGSLSGPFSGWPAIQDMEPPDRPGVFRLIRIGPEDIRRHFDHGFLTDEQRSKVMRKKRSELAKRRREQRAEVRRAGVLAANWAYDVIFRRLDAI